MKKLLTIILLFMSSLLFAQTGIEEGTYKSNLDDIIIRNDSVITKNVQYYIFHYGMKYDEKLNLVSLEYFSENNKHQLVVVYKDGIPRHLMFSYIGYQDETYNIVFEK